MLFIYIYDAFKFHLVQLWFNTDLLDSLSSYISQLMDSRHAANLVNLVQKHNT